MKLRHALTAVAAAAVIAPAVLATPAAASATETPSPSTPANKAQKDCASAPKHLQMAIKGLQSAFIAGAGWSHSSLTVTNTSDKAMEKVRPRPYISSSEIVDRPYEELEAQFRNPVTGKWLSFEDATSDSEFTGFPVAAHRTVTLPLRIREINSAKPGAGYAIVEGTFANQDGSCGTSNHEQYHFKILPARGKPGRPSTPDKPSESATPGGGVAPGGDLAPGGGVAPGGDLAPGGGVADGPEPQGGVQKTPGEGQLAATGSPAALPTIALVSGVAMAVGAGAIISARRRRAAAGSSDGTGATA
ncbi:hypothetical protein YWIDRAFT_07779 [Streptomyces sp. SceaMP-e96]|uniref:cell wall protein n=1 Tax=unclassified Streptomyces TaxID=2593676 RepID=UPI000823F385|nr:MULTISPECIES: cell wall protein [unclassified Streptomyces]MYT18113.1 cell wall protein [Streptomyces sp. SID4951]SCK51042.1 hypothetical protein YWIDRAFT_07779 [Streptomyces sp. SceaMP-e96]